MTSLPVRAVRKAQRLAMRRVKPAIGAYRAAVIGCGSISGEHIQDYEMLSDCYTLAAADISGTAIGSTLDMWSSLRGFQNYAQMLREVRPDVVSVCTWPQIHAEVVEHAARAGVKGILCEKPLALQMDHVEQMLRVCEEAGVKLACGHQNRFHPAFVAAAQAILSGQLGDIRNVSGAIRGSIANNGTHLIDTIRFLLGDRSAVSVTGHCVREKDTMERGLPCEETSQVEIHFANDISCLLTTGHSDPRAFRITVEGTAGSLTVTPWSFDIKGTTRSFTTEVADRECRFQQFRQFVDWVKGRREEYPANAASAAATAELVLACYESSRLNEPVLLPLCNNGDVIRRCFAHSDTGITHESANASLFWDFANTLAPRDRPAICGGRRVIGRWFSSSPRMGVGELKNLAKVIRSKELNCVGATMVPQLERDFAKFYGSPSAVASTSGTAAIHVALGTLNPEPCDEIITTPISDMGTVIPILACNCIPVFADVDPETGSLSAQTIAAKITSRTKAVILVHLFGRPANLPPIVQLLKEKGICLIEDCAQAHGAEFDGKMVGTWGDFGCFSLQQSKQITCGDGGLTLVNRPELAVRAHLFVDKGWARGGSRKHEFLGMNYRMTELQGAVALAQLGRLPELLSIRRSSAEQLKTLLADVPGVALPPADDRVRSSWWKFPFGADSKVFGPVHEEFYQALRAEGIRMMKQYLPRPLFEEAMFRHRRTYGQSGYPLTSPNYHTPCVDDYPGLQEFNRRWLLMEWSSRVRAKHVSQIAASIGKVAAALNRRRATT